MKTLKYVLVFVLIIALLAPAGAAWADPDGGGKGGGGGGGKGGKPGGETAGNNLSYPVIWAEGVEKDLRGSMDEVKLEGNYWYIAADGITPICLADPDNQEYCDDEEEGTFDESKTLPAAIDTLFRAYVQKDDKNEWQAWNGNPDTVDLVTPLFNDKLQVDQIDWGDNLESVDWYTRSQVRTEVVLFQNLAEQVLEYDMRHVSGWGIDEVHGLATEPAALGGTANPIFGAGDQATVYSPCARLTIQKLFEPREYFDPTYVVDPDPLTMGQPQCLQWNPTTSVWSESSDLSCTLEGDLINEDFVFNKAVWQALDGPGYYNAEINVKGRIIYGYTWNVRQDHDDTNPEGEPTAAGDYRITFSFDETCGTTTLKTSFADGVTQIMVPIEEEAEITAADEGGDTGGATAVLRTDLNLTYIDVRILERGGGGGGGGGGKPQAAAASFMPRLPFEPAEVISVDVKPQACPNVINIDLPGPDGNGHGPGGPGNGNGGEGGGHVRVAALGSDAVDVTKIQAGSVRLLVPAGDGFVELTPEADHTVVEDVASVYPDAFTEPLTGYECLVAGGDGYDDMNFMFEATELAEALAGMQEQTATLVYLTGMLEGGLSFAGADVILLNEGGAPDDPGNTPIEQIFVPMARNFGQ